MSAEKKITVIVTDDHSLFRMGVKNGLNRYPNIKVVAEAENGQELLELLEKNRPDVVIMGIQMPVMDGAKAMPIIRQRYPGQKVIILSMYSDSSVVTRMLELGANAYLSKESGSEAIYQAIIGCQQQWLHITNLMTKSFAALWEKKEKETREQKQEYSETERRVINYVLADVPEEAMAKHLDLSPGTVAAIIDKLKTKTRTTSKERLKQFFEKNKPEPITTPPVKAKP